MEGKEATRKACDGQGGGASAATCEAEARDLWVFAYGSLMWRPGFVFTDRTWARLSGYRRSFCIYSVYHRGTPLRPGLVLGLDRGGVCEGVAYRIEAARAAQTIAYLREREQVTGVYREALVPVTLLRGERPEVSALAYLVERAHPSYAGMLPVALQARVIRAAEGRSGGNLEYLISTLSHLEELGIREPELERVLTFTGRLLTRGASVEASVKALRRAAQGKPAVGIARLRPGERKRFIHRKAFGARSI